MTDIDRQGFENKSKEIARRFLQTAVFVDDKAFFDDAEPENADTENFPLNVKEVMDVFAKKGMICSVLKPKFGDRLDINESVKRASKRADVVVLDWNLDDDRGETTIEIIRAIIEEDRTENGRLRLIVIYSSQEPRRSGINPFCNTKKQFPELEEDEEVFALKKDHLRIAFYHKIKSKSDQLPEIFVSEFAKITAGLLSNVALESISVIRDNTHLLLGSLGTEIDPAYLAHRALLPFPDDAMDQAVEIVASELKSILENYQVGNKADRETILYWLNSNNGDGPYIIYKPDSNGIVRISVKLEEIGRLLEIGLEEFGKGFSPINDSGQGDNEERIGKSAFKYLTKSFCFNGESDSDIECINCDYAILASQKNHYGRPQNRPMLTLGTIVKEVADEKPASANNYWICIQPRCDCVRIGKPRNFVFLPLTVVDKNGFGLIIKEGDEYKKFKIDRNIYNCQSFEFSVDDPEKIVRAAYLDENFYFTSEEAGKKFLWLTELKSEHAQRLSNDIAALLSRVGLNESEWLRLWS